MVSASLIRFGNNSGSPLAETHRCQMDDVPKSPLGLDAKATFPSCTSTRTSRNGVSDIRQKQSAGFPKRGWISPAPVRLRSILLRSPSLVFLRLVRNLRRRFHQLRIGSARFLRQYFVRSAEQHPAAELDHALRLHRTAGSVHPVEIICGKYVLIFDVYMKSVGLTRPARLLTSRPDGPASAFPHISIPTTPSRPSVVPCG